MHLMMCGADKDVPQPAAEWNPTHRMLKMHVGMDEQHQYEVGIVQGVLIGGLAEHVVPEAAGNGRRESENIAEDPGVDGVHAEIREWGQHFRVVMHFVKFPQKRDLVA